MGRRTLFQLVAFVAASYIATALIAWALITAIKYVKEHQAMCICPTTEQHQAPAKQDSVIAELKEKIKEAGTYLELHHPAVTESIKALGVEMPAFSIHAPVLVDLRKTLDRLVPTLGDLAVSKGINLPSRKAQHDLDRFFLAPGVIECMPSDKAIKRIRRIAGVVLAVSIAALLVIINLF